MQWQQFLIIIVINLHTYNKYMFLLNIKRVFATNITLNLILNLVLIIYIFEIRIILKNIKIKI